MRSQTVTAEAITSVIGSPRIQLSLSLSLHAVSATSEAELNFQRVYTSQFLKTVRILNTKTMNSLRGILIT